MQKINTSLKKGRVEKSRGIPGSTLKIAAVVAMVMDHTAWCILDPILYSKKVYMKNFLSPLFQIGVSPVLCVLSPVFHIVGRITFPIMLFLLVEGVKYSKNKLKYIRNMVIFSFLSEIPFDLAFSNKLYRPGNVIPYVNGQNVFVTLTFCLITLIIIEEIYKKEKISKILRIVSSVGPLLLCFGVAWYLLKRTGAALDLSLGAPAFAAVFLVLFVIYLIVARKKEPTDIYKLNLSLFVVFISAGATYLLDSDYRFMGVVAAALMYALRKEKTTSFFFGCTYLTANSYLEFGTFLAMPLIANYNGKRGIKLKYFFYIVYPAHLLILWMIRNLLI